MSSTYDPVGDSPTFPADLPDCDAPTFKASLDNQSLARRGLWPFTRTGDVHEQP